MDKIAIWTININNYEPEVCKLTYPLIKHFANRIGADFNEITTRKFPEMGVYYEKMQLYELSKDYDWNIFLDADVILHPDMFNFLNKLPKDTVLFWKGCVDQPCNIRFRDNKYFNKDGRYLDIISSIFVFSNQNRKWLKPTLLKYSKEYIIDQIFDVYYSRHNRKLTLEKGFVFDEYQMTLNLSRYKIKAFEIDKYIKQTYFPNNQAVNLYSFFYHKSLTWGEDKVKNMQNILRDWKIDIEELQGIYK